MSTRVRTLPPPAELRRIIEAAGLSGTDVAERVGVARSTACRWLAGTVVPQRSHLPAIFALLDALAGVE